MPYLINADARLLPLADKSVHCCVTSPPYFGLRDYGTAGQIGLEPTPAEYVTGMVAVFREVWRVLRDDGVLWLNLGDSYAASPGQRKATDITNSPKQKSNIGSVVVGSRTAAGCKPKDLIGIPWMVAFALRADGWYLRQDIIWSKRAPMPESVRDRCTKSHEYLFLLTKSPKYFYDAEAIKEASIHPRDDRKARSKEHHKDRLSALTARINPGSSTYETRNCRSVWTLSTTPCKDAHFATFPLKLPERCILSGTSAKGCCPACGAQWKRVVDRVRTATRTGENSKVAAARDKLPSEEPGRNRGAERFAMTTLGSIVGNRDPQRHVSQSITTAWVPSCKCDAGEPIPCTVLDNFNGAGTTGIACKFHGRRYIGTEINPAYIDISRRRILVAVPVKVKRAKVRRVHEDQQSLFAEARP